MSAVIQSLVTQLTEAVKVADLSTRHKLSTQLQRLARSIATPRQVMQHFGYTYTEQVAAKAAVDLHIFKILAESDAPLKTEEIAAKSGGDPVLIDRILRHLASTYAVDEVGQSTFTANECTRYLSTPPGEGNIVFGFNILNKSFQQLPAFLKDKTYHNPEETLDTPFHKAFDTKMQYFLYIQQDRETIHHFFPSLSAFKSPVSWTSVVPLAEQLNGADQNKPIFVDIGGGHGYQCAAFREATRDRFHGRVINQDLPETLAQAPKYDDIEMMVQDFYEENQIKGSKFYYSRQCLHDLPDKTAKVFLRRVREAMSQQSVFLIDELIIPDTGASRFAMQLDFTMMAMFSSLERTISQWRSLLEECGLEIRQVYRYDPEIEYSIIEAIPI